jgi:hypothetical protein
MRTLVDDTLRHEAARYHFRFGCEHCAHFEPERRVCSEGFPNAPHLEVDMAVILVLEFCKSFELV